MDRKCNTIALLLSNIMIGVLDTVLENIEVSADFVIE